MRDKNLENIRPQIEGISMEKHSNASEEFQNKTLRPILKFQHDLIVAVFENYIENRKGVFHTLSEEKKKEYIKNSLARDLKFRNLMMGLVLGHFTIKEWDYFQKNHSELTRRTMSMMAARLESQLL